MSNMSYCRFRNTLKDLHDCRDAMNEGFDTEDTELSQDEKNAKDDLLALIADMADEFTD